MPVAISWILVSGGQMIMIAIKPFHISSLGFFGMCWKGIGASILIGAFSVSLSIQLQHVVGTT